MRLVRFPGGAVGEIDDPPDDLHREARSLESASTRDYATKHPDVPAEEPPADRPRLSLDESDQLFSERDRLRLECEELAESLYVQQKQVASLSSQLEAMRSALPNASCHRMDEDPDADIWATVARDGQGFVRTQDEWDTLAAHARDLSSQLERLKAENKTFGDAHTAAWEEIHRLRRLSQSDTPK